MWLSSVCWSSSAKPGNEVQCGIYGGWVKTTVQFEAICGPKFMLIWDNIGDPLWFATHLTDCLCRVLFRRYRPLKMALPVSCEVIQKGDFGTLICRGRGYPTFWTCVFKLHLLSTRWPIFCRKSWNCKICHVWRSTCATKQLGRLPKSAVQPVALHNTHLICDRMRTQSQYAH